MIPIPSRRKPPIQQVLEIMAALRSPKGCPWDREQNHQSLRWHAVEEVYEVLDAIESGDFEEMAEELGDLLLQVVFHAQLAREAKLFDFNAICQRLADKLVRRHPHVFGDVRVKNVDQVWANWEQIKRSEKKGSSHERRSVLDGIPRKLPSLMRAQKLVKKARKAGLIPQKKLLSPRSTNRSRAQLGDELFTLAEACESKGLSSEALLRTASAKRERQWRAIERKKSSA